MDSSEVTHISLFAGYGGLDLGLKRSIAGLRTICYVERELFAIANLVAKMDAGGMDAAPIWPDVRTFPAREFKGVDIISAGFPCQPFSHAGQRRFSKDERFLLGDVLRIVAAVRPSRVFLENVEGYLSTPPGHGGWDYLYPRLRYMGYRVEADLFSAEEVGAPQQRKRVFILADTESVGWGEERQYFQQSTKRTAGANEKLGNAERDGSSSAEEQGSSRSAVCDNSEGENTTGKSPGASDTEKLADSVSKRFQGGERAGPYSEQGSPTHGSIAQCSDLWPARPGEEQYEWEPPRTVKSEMGRNTDGHPDWMVQSTNRIDELRLIGNGVVPATAERAYRVLSEKLRCMTKN